MSELKVFIADDEEPARERLKTLLGDIAPQVPAQVVGEARNGVRGDRAAAAERRAGAAARHPDAGHGRPGGGAPPGPAANSRRRIIFVTAHDRHAVEAFELNALDYLLKPVRAERLAAALKKATVPENARALEKAARGAARVPVAGRAQPHRAGAGARHPLPARRREVRHGAHARARAPRRGAAGRARAASSPTRFVRIHRNCLVARAAIRGFERAAATTTSEAHWLVVLDGLEERLPVSRRQWPAVRELVT